MRKPGVISGLFNKLYGKTVMKNVFCFVGIQPPPSLKVKYDFLKTSYYGKTSIIVRRNHSMRHHQFLDILLISGVNHQQINTAG